MSCRRPNLSSIDGFAEYLLARFADKAAVLSVIHKDSVGILKWCERYMKNGLKMMMPEDSWLYFYSESRKRASCEETYSQNG